MQFEICTANLSPAASVQPELSDYRRPRTTPPLFFRNRPSRLMSVGVGRNAITRHRGLPRNGEPFTLCMETMDEI